MKINDYKEKIAKTSHYLYHKGLVPGKSGNISVKICFDNDCRVIITPSGVSLKDVNSESLVMVDVQGNLIEMQENSVESQNKPSSELEMHLKIYQERNDVGAVVHTHSPYATGFSHSKKLIPRLEGFGKIKDPYIKQVEYALPGSVALANMASHGLKEEDDLILKNHGVLAVGADLDQAVLLAEFIESSAKIGFVAHALSREPILTHLKHSR